ncbi:MAG: OmpA family protein [Bacteroidales bacterium]|nr:OmpA family protein [Bacteroidales bacterium]
MTRLRQSMLLAVLLTVAINGWAQDKKNLVKNYSFEDYEECPIEHNAENQSHKIIPYWTYPTHAAADYFNKCSAKDAGVPKNFAGVSEPKSGKAYAGAILSGTSEGRREYIQGELAKPLAAGNKYCVTLYYRLASGSQVAVDQISVHLGKQIMGTGTEALGVVPQLNNQDGLFLDDKDEWKQICHVYVAIGGETHFIIGNFKNVEHTNYVITDINVVNERDKAYAYYYFDDVVIRPLDDCRACPCVQHDFEAAVKDTFYTGGLNPITGRVNKIINDGRISLALIGGVAPYTVKWSNGAVGASLRNLPAGTYQYTAFDQNNCLATGQVTFVEPVIEKDEFEDGLRSIEEGEAIVLENIFFEFGKATLLPSSYAELDKVVAFMKETDIKIIEISGHTDSDGTAAYNQKLSEGRAKSVVDYLVSKGISASRLLAAGYGLTRPIDTNQRDEGKAKNRRVEFRLVKK